MCVWLWNWTCLGLIPPIGHTYSKNRNQFCFLFSPLISLLAVPFLSAPPAYTSHVLKIVLPPYGTLPAAYFFVNIPLSLSVPPLLSCCVPLMCVVIVSCEYTALTGSTKAGCHRAAQMGLQFTMSIGSQVSVCQLHSWAGERELFKCSSTLSLTSGINILPIYTAFFTHFLHFSGVSAALHFHVHSHIFLQHSSLSLSYSISLWIYIKKPPQSHNPLHAH